MDDYSTIRRFLDERLYLGVHCGPLTVEEHRLVNQVVSHLQHGGSLIVVANLGKLIAELHMYPNKFDTALLKPFDEHAS